MAGSGKKKPQTNIKLPLFGGFPKKRGCAVAVCWSPLPNCPFPESCRRCCLPRSGRGDATHPGPGGSGTERAVPAGRQFCAPELFFSIYFTKDHHFPPVPLIARRERAPLKLLSAASLWGPCPASPSFGTPPPPHCPVGCHQRLSSSRLGPSLCPPSQGTPWSPPPASGTGGCHLPRLGPVGAGPWGTGGGEGEFRGTPDGGRSGGGDAAAGSDGILERNGCSGSRDACSAR